MADDADFWHAGRGTVPSGAGEGSTVVAQEDPMRRLRGHTGQPPTWGRRRGLVEVWVPEARGPMICSRMAYRSGDQHAPVFDVDLPVVAVRQCGGGAGLVLTGLLGPTRLRRLWQGLSFLARNGFVREEDVPVVRGQLRAVMESDAAGRLVLPVSFPARTVPSANPEHRHLYVDLVMPFAQSVRLARALGFVDPDHIARSRRLGQWQVRLAWRSPVVTRPEVTRPQVTQPQVTQPQVTRPEVPRPEVPQPAMAQPVVAPPPKSPARRSRRVPLPRGGQEPVTTAPRR